MWLVDQTGVLEDQCSIRHWLEPKKRVARDREVLPNIIELNLRVLYHKRA